MENESFRWRGYDDGSGCMETKYGRTLFSYDERTREIKYPDGEYRRMEDDWKRDAEDYYMKEVVWKEHLYAGLLENDIFYPFLDEFPGPGGALARCAYVALTDTYGISADKFCELYQGMKKAADDAGYGDLTMPQAAEKMCNAVKFSAGAFEYAGHMFRMGLLSPFAGTRTGRCRYRAYFATDKLLAAGDDAFDAAMECVAHGSGNASGKAFRKLLEEYRNDPEALGVLDRVLPCVCGMTLDELAKEALERGEREL